MHDARDAEDKRLLDQGEHKQLVANYFDTVRTLARARANNAHDGDEIASIVFLRLLRELEGGKRYPLPFRLVVPLVVRWCAHGYYGSRERDPLALPDDWEGEPTDGVAEWVERTDLSALFSRLPGRAQEVATLRYLVGLSHDEIAEQLEVERNTVDQALWRAHQKLRELVADA
jgi:RNA polymerase sigma factor (sigma-70 family)